MKQRVTEKITLALLVAGAVVAAAEPVLAGGKLSVVTTIPDLAAIAREVGGEAVEVESITKGYQDPHYVQAKPSYMLEVRRADLLFYVGLDLETGWLPLLVEGARNSRLRSLAVSDGIAILEVPGKDISRAQGDIHPQGNPHYWLDPRNGIVVARTIAHELASVDPSRSAYFSGRAGAFADRLGARIAQWEEAMAGRRGKRVVAYHKQWEYLARWLGLEIAGYIEDKPGIPPSPAHLAELIREMKAREIPCVLAATFTDPKIPELVAEKAGARFVVLPSSVGALPEASDYISLFDVITERLAQALAENGGS